MLQFECHSERAAGMGGCCSSKDRNRDQDLEDSGRQAATIKCDKDGSSFTMTVRLPSHSLGSSLKVHPPVPTQIESIALVAHLKE